MKEGKCIMGEMRKDREGEEQDNPTLFDTGDKIQNRPLVDTMDERAYYELKNENERLRKRVQEAEGEMTIVKGIGMNSPEMKDAKAKIKELEEGLANALEVNESHQNLNGKLQTRLTELEEENKKIHDALNNKITDARKAGL